MKPNTNLQSAVGAWAKKHGFDLTPSKVDLGSVEGADGTIYDFPGDTIAVDSPVTVGGEVVADGTYELIDGSSIVLVNGTVSEILPAAPAEGDGDVPPVEQGQPAFGIDELIGAFNPVFTKMKMENEAIKVDYAKKMKESNERFDAHIVKYDELVERFDALPASNITEPTGDAPKGTTRDRHSAADKKAQERFMQAREASKSTK